MISDTDLLSKCRVTFDTGETSRSLYSIQRGFVEEGVKSALNGNLTYNYTLAEQAVMGKPKELLIVAPKETPDRYIGIAGWVGGGERYVAVQAVYFNVSNYKVKSMVSRPFPYHEKKSHQVRISITKAESTSSPGKQSAMIKIDSVHDIGLEIVNGPKEGEVKPGRKQYGNFCVYHVAEGVSVKQIDKVLEAIFPGIDVVRLKSDRDYAQGIANVLKDYVFNDKLTRRTTLPVKIN